MEAHTDLDRDRTSRGIMLSYVDAHGRRHHAPEPTLARIDRTLAGDPTPTASLVVAPGAPAPGLHGTATAADGTRVQLTGRVPADATPGRYRLTDGTPVVIAPSQAPVAPEGWGWAVQLYAARTDRSWGIGDYADLAWLTAAAAADGAAAVLVSPLHATHPRHPADSPYAPASREWLNLLHIAIADVPGVDRVDVTDLATQAAALNDSWLLDRSHIWHLKRTALERIYAAVAGDLPAEFEDFLTAGGESLATFCTWSVLADRHEGPWWEWPTEYRRPDSDAAQTVADVDVDRVRFWAWCQWVADTQLAAACGNGVDVVLDLAVGFDGGGSDGWRYQDLLAFDFEVGAPPDKRNLEGQRWGLPPFRPAALAAAGFEPWLAAVRSALRHAHALRMDHVTGLWRLFWVPADGTAADGVYVRYPVEEVLGLLRAEAARRGAWLVGEDMGTVEDGVRDTMAAGGMLGYRVATRVAPEEFPAQVMASAETHDQPTVPGIVTGDDLRLCRLAGKDVDEQKLATLRADLVARGDRDPDARLHAADVAAVVAGVYRDIATSAAQLTLVTVDDVALATERPNIPNITDTYPCWRLPLRSRLDVVHAGPLARTVVAQFRAAGR